jgi:hypothetical protein
LKQGLTIKSLTQGLTLKLDTDNTPMVIISPKASRQEDANGNVLDAHYDFNPDSTRLLNVVPTSSGADAAGHVMSEDRHAALDARALGGSLTRSRRSPERGSHVRISDVHYRDSSLKVMSEEAAEAYGMRGTQRRQKSERKVRLASEDDTTPIRERRRRSKVEDGQDQAFDSENDGRRPPHSPSHRRRRRSRRAERQENDTGDEEDFNVYEDVSAYGDAAVAIGHQRKPSEDTTGGEEIENQEGEQEGEAEEEGQKHRRRRSRKRLGQH